MRYFTPELFLQLNSSDGKAVDEAMERWERAITAYRKSLQRIRRKMPAQSQAIADLSLHDWNLVGIRRTREGIGGANPAGSALFVLKSGQDLLMLLYALTREWKVIDAPKEWSLSKRRVHWLYDELDTIGNDPESLIHRILLSDGTTVLVPFSHCQIWRVSAKRAMSRSDLLQTA